MGMVVFWLVPRCALGFLGTPISTIKRVSSGAGAQGDCSSVTSTAGAPRRRRARPGPDAGRAARALRAGAPDRLGSAWLDHLRRVSSNHLDWLALLLYILRRLRPADPDQM